jgi:diguanylate cyclase (GGDEF)-like protein
MKPDRSLLSETPDEEGRLRALRRLQALDTPPEEAFENVVSLARSIFDVPICAISLIDADRQWFKAYRGLAMCETSRDVSFCSHAIKRPEPLVITDANADARFAQNPLVTGAPFIRSYAGVPLQTPDGYRVGALCAIDTKPRVFTSADVAVLEKLATTVVEQLELRLVSCSDALTGALTRRAWFNLAERAIESARLSREPLSVAVFDVDHFKKINDTFGHAQGDFVLRDLAESCHASIRASDRFGRLGGEEFALVLPGCGLSEAEAIADRIRRQFGSQQHDLGGPVTCTLSGGVAQLEAADVSVDDLLARADAAMYVAKQGGRDQITIHTGRHDAARRAAFGAHC